MLRKHEKGRWYSSAAGCGTDGTRYLAATRSVGFLMPCLGHGCHALGDGAWGEVLLASNPLGSNVAAGGWCGALSSVV